MGMGLVIVLENIHSKLASERSYPVLFRYT